METTDIINNSEEIVETATEEIAAVGSGSALKYVATFGVGAIAGILTWEYVIKPLWGRYRGRKTNRHPDATVEGEVIEVKEEPGSDDET